MQFIFPNFLWALGLLAIPIIIHLFYFRRFKKVYFTNVKFLKEVKEETSSRSKIKNLLILLSRLLAAAAMIFAFAQPYIPSNEQKIAGKKGISVYVDNSYSMSAQANDVSLLNKAKQKAQEIISAYGEDERFQILSNNFSAIQQRILTKEEALNAIDGILERPEVYPLSQVYNRQRQALNQENFDSKIFYQISDFQRNITDAFAPEDSTEQINLIPLQSVQDINVSIDSSWFESTIPMIGQANKLIIKLTNHSDEDKEGIRLNVNYENQTKPLGIKSINARSSILDTVSLTLTQPGWNTAKISIVDYPITFDDNYQIAFEVKDQIDVLTISENTQNAYLDALFKGINLINSSHQKSSKISYSEFSNYELIILDDLNNISSGLSAAIATYIQNGGNILIFPGKNANTQSYNPFLSNINANTLSSYIQKDKEVGNLNMEEYLFRDVFESRVRNITLPKVSGAFAINNLQARGEERILTFRDGKTYLGKYRKGLGNVYLCASPLDQDINNLVQNAEIFVPMIFKMSISSGAKYPIAYTIGKNRNIEIPEVAQNNDIVYRIEGTESYIPSQLRSNGKTLLNVGDNITKAGIYNVVLGENEIQKVAYNYNNLESELDYYNTEDLTNLYGDDAIIFSNQLEANFSQLITEKDQGRTYWRWCLILALIFLGIEQLLLRLLKS